MVVEYSQLQLADPSFVKNPPPGDFFYIVDLDRVESQLTRWRKLMPRVQPHYAVKCNPDPGILRTLAIHGAGFDCASKDELEAVLNLGLDIDNSRIIYANPSKMRNHLKYVINSGVDLMTFDSEDELYKIADIAPNARLILRIYTTDASESLIPLGTKFGARYEDCADLIAKALELNLQVVGVSFHVGSGCFHVNAFTDAIKLGRRVFDMAQNEFGLEFNVLDIGGGWPGSEDETLHIEDLGAAITPLLDEIFPANVRIISEPGRYFACQSHTLVTKVLSAHAETENGEVKYTYVLPEGVYGPFKDALLVGQKFMPYVMPSHGRPEREFTSTLRGPTDSPLDVISKDITLPKLEVGDWLYFVNMGAYSRSLASQNHAFGDAHVVYIPPDAKGIPTCC